jgi:aminoglycoside phosphotransferase
MESVDSTEDPLIQIVRTHQNNTNSAKVWRAKSHKRELQEGKRQTKESIAEKTKERWREQRMHGQFPRNLDEKLVDNEQSYRWLKFGNIKGETESIIVAAQDQAILQTILKIKFERRS